MASRGALRAPVPMTDHENPDIEVVAERFERRLAEETGKVRIELKQEISDLRVELKQEIGDLRVEVKQEIGDLRVEVKQEIGDLRLEMTRGFGELRAEMIDRNTKLLKWWLVFATTQTGVIAALLALLG